MQKALSIEMKHGRELVIIGLVAMQGCSYLKSQGSGEPWRDPQSWKTSNSAE